MKCNKTSCWFCSWRKIVGAAHDPTVDCDFPDRSKVYLWDAELCHEYTTKPVVRKESGVMKERVVKFVFDKTEVEVKVTMEKDPHNKYIIKGTVKRVDNKNIKGLFYIWDCTPMGDGKGGIRKKYDKPLLIQGGYKLPAFAIAEEQRFVMAALEAYKLAHNDEKNINKMCIPVISRTGSQPIPEGFERVDDKEVFATC